MRRSLNEAKVSPFLTTLALSSGGTSKTDKDQAAASIGLVAINSINAISGVAGLGSNGLLPASIKPTDLNVDRATINGPLVMTVNTTETFTITNFSDFRQYNITAISGSFTRVGDTISYTSPSSFGIGGFIINGHRYEIAVGPPFVNTPTITGPVNNAVDVVSPALIIANAFSSIGAIDTHQMTDWQISSNNTFTSIVFESLSDTTNLTEITQALPAFTLLYVRVRYRGNILGWSAWSNTISFTTE